MVISFAVPKERTGFLFILTRATEFAELYEKGKFSEAIPVVAKILSSAERENGADHEETARWRINLALLHQQLKQYDEAEPFLEQAVATLEEKLGHGHPDTSRAAHFLATNYQLQDKLEKAEARYILNLEIQEKLLALPDSARWNRGHDEPQLRLQDIVTESAWEVPRKEPAASLESVLEGSRKDPETLNVTLEGQVLQADQPGSRIRPAETQPAAQHQLAGRLRDLSRQKLVSELWQEIADVEVVETEAPSAVPEDRLGFGDYALDPLDELLLTGDPVVAMNIERAILLLCFSEEVRLLGS